MKLLLTLIAIGLLAYVLTWSIAYVVVMGFDFRYYLEYLRLSWTKPGEIPAFIQWASLVTTGIIMIVVFFWLRKET